MHVIEHHHDDHDSATDHLHLLHHDHNSATDHDHLQLDHDDHDDHSAADHDHLHFLHHDHDSATDHHHLHDHHLHDHHLHDHVHDSGTDWATRRRSSRLGRMNWLVRRRTGVTPLALKYSAMPDSVWVLGNDVPISSMRIDVQGKRVTVTVRCARL